MSIHSPSCRYSISPEAGDVSPSIILSKVVLPAPDCPMRDTISPLFISSERSLKFSTSPTLIRVRRLLMSFTLMMVSFFSKELISTCGRISLRKCFSTVSVFPSSIICPSSRYMRRSEIYMCSSGRWETTIIGMFSSFFTFFITSRTSCFVPGPVIVTGSSSNNSFGFATI